MARCLLLAAASAAAPFARAADVSAPATLQLFEARWTTADRRAADLFFAGYGSVWLPPPGRADSGNQSVGYDVYDRFDLGTGANQTLYGSEAGLKAAVANLRRAGVSTITDLVLNHNGFSDKTSPGFQSAGAYPGFTFTPATTGFDGDFHLASASGDLDGRTSGLIDIAHESNNRFIRNPVVPGDARNLPAGTTTYNGRTANVATAANRRFYPTVGPTNGRTFFNPSTGQNFTRYDYTATDATTGTPVEENATGYLMRQAQWMVQTIGVDGFRLDATKHVPTWFLNGYYDAAVYGANTRKLLDGSTQQVFSFGENFDGNKSYLQTYIRKDINPAAPNTIGGNRDTLDFPLFFAMQANLTANGLANDWRNVVSASIDSQDDGNANNGSQGVAFVQSHDQGGPALGNVAYAYTLMRPGNAIVYQNAREFGTGRDFPKDGRGDALGGLYGNAITTLTNLRNTHGRGDYINRLVEKETVAYERDRSALVVLSNRGDSGFDARSVSTNFTPGQWLVEMTGNATSTTTDPNGDIPDAVQVGASGLVNFRALRNGTHGKGYLIYGLPTPAGAITLGNVAQTFAGGTPTAATNGTTRLASVDVIQSDTFTLGLDTTAYSVLGQYRDADADGNNAVFSINGGKNPANGLGVDLNGQGGVDYVTPGTTTYGFEEFRTVKTPGTTTADGNGMYRQTIDASKLAEGYNYLEVRAFRRRNDGGPSVYSSFKKTLYVDRLKPESSVASFLPFDTNNSSNRDVIVRSDDLTAAKVHVFLNLPANVTDATIRGYATSNTNPASQIDRDAFKYGFFSVPNGNNVVTIYTEEITGTWSVKRVAGQLLATSRGRGLGDLNYDGQFSPADVFGGGALEQFVYSRDAQFNPAADFNGDGRNTTVDMFAAEVTYKAAGATAATLTEIRNAVLRRGNIDNANGTSAADIDALFARFAATGDVWTADLNANGIVGQGDVNLLVGGVFLTSYGDANLDGQVSKADLDILRLQLGQSGTWATGDFTGDGLVTNSDLNWLRLNFGIVGAGGTFPAVGNDLAVTPEPASLMLAAAASLMLLRRTNRSTAKLKDTGRGRGGNETRFV